MYDLCSNGPYDQEEEETKGVGERAPPYSLLVPSALWDLRGCLIWKFNLSPLSTRLGRPRLLDVPEPKLEIALAEHWGFLNPFTSGGLSRHGLLGLFGRFWVSVSVSAQYIPDSSIGKPGS